MRWLAFLWLAFAATPGLAETTAAGADDAAELVATYCGACHSLAIVRQQRLSRRVWEEVLVWMVEEQGMAELDPADRSTILDFLAETYAPDRAR